MGYQGENSQIILVKKTNKKSKLVSILSWIGGKSMECELIKTCPHARNCSIIQEAQFCGYHQGNVSEKPPKAKQKKPDIDFIPEE